MREGSFLDQKRMSPMGFTLVVIGHAVVLGAVVLIKGPEIIGRDFTETIIFTPSPPPTEPPPPPEPQKQQVEVPKQRSTIDVPPPIERLPAPGPVFQPDPLPPIPQPLPPGPVDVVPADPPPLREPVRVEARYDDRYASALQPPYPPSEQRAQRDGQVRMRVTIGVDGRVKAVERLSATSDAFWSMAERHALSRWRFKPATVDGRPVESQKVMTLHFRIENV
jgi:protein TonB